MRRHRPSSGVQKSFRLVPGLEISDIGCQPPDTLYSGNIGRLLEDLLDLSVCKAAKNVPSI